MKTRPLGLLVLTLSGVLSGVLASCSGDENTSFSSDVPAGAERGACRQGGDCDVGLECRSDVCVSADPGNGGSNNTGTGGSGTSAAGDSSSSGGKGSTGGTNPSGGTNMSEGGASQADAGGAGGAGDPNDAGGAGGAALECEGSHPLVSGKNRYCAVGACYCNDPFDTCFPAVTAAACCENTPRCGADPADRGVNCTGSHPIIEPVRTCAPGNCFCSDGQGGDWDVCLPQAVADSCCPPGVSLTCVN
jgi:hypothetical protein